jgi:hypothetical protein
MMKDLCPKVICDPATCAWLAWLLHHDRISGNLCCLIVQEYGRGVTAVSVRHHSSITGWHTCKFTSSHARTTTFDQFFGNFHCSCLNCDCDGAKLPQLAHYCAKDIHNFDEIVGAGEFLISRRG